MDWEYFLWFLWSWIHIIVAIGIPTTHETKSEIAPHDFSPLEFDSTIVCFETVEYFFPLCFTDSYTVGGTVVVCGGSLGQETRVDSCNCCEKWKIIHWQTYRQQFFSGNSLVREFLYLTPVKAFSCVFELNEL